MTRTYTLRSNLNPSSRNGCKCKEYISRAIDCDRSMLAANVIATHMSCDMELLAFIDSRIAIGCPDYFYF